MRQLPLPRSLPAVLFAALLLLSILARPVRAGDNVWTPIGPYGGGVRTFAFHPSQPGVMWVGTASNGVFRSTDGGATWTPMNRGLPQLFRTVVFLDVSTAGRLTLYARTSSVILRSVGGGPWEMMTSEPGIMYFKADPFRADVLWAGSNLDGPGIDRSDDGGATWTRVYSLAGGSRGALPTGFVFAPGDPSTLYAGLSSSEGSPQGVARSRDGGVTWEVVHSGLDLPAQDDVTVNLEVAPDTGVLFAAVDWTDAGHRQSEVYRSADGGDHWVRVLTGGGRVTAGPGGLVLSESGQRSLDGGLTWSPLILPGDSFPVLIAHPLSSGIVFIGPSYLGVYRSADSGTSWRESNQGLLAAQALDLVVDPVVPGTLYASLAGGGLFKTTTGGLVWEHLLPRAGDIRFRLFDELAAAPAGGETTLYVLSDDREAILRSEDSGATWTGLGNPGLLRLLALAVDPRAPRSLYAGGESFERCPARKSTDGGETWRCLGLGMIRDLVVDPSRPANVWAVSRTVYRSTDRGRTWRPANRGLRATNVLTLAVAPSSSGIVYAGSGEGAYKTTDGGRSWSPVNRGLPPFATVIALAVHPRNPSIVYAGVGVGGGVYRSTNGGGLWRPLRAGLPPASFFGPLVLDPHDPQTLYAGTSTRGFYAITLRR